MSAAPPCHTIHTVTITSQHHQSSTQPAEMLLPAKLNVEFTLHIVPLIQLVIGAIYQYDCPRQPNIPIYMLVMGGVCLVLDVLYVTPCGYLMKHTKFWKYCVNIFFFCWFIAGNVWIYSIYEPNYNKTVSLDTYCNKTLYLCAFWTTNLFYIVCGLVILCRCFSALLRDDSQTN